MDFQALINISEKTTKETGKPFPSSDSIVLTSRIRIARNLSGHAFPGWTKAEQRQKILSAILPVLKDIPSLKGGFFAEMDQLTPLEKQVLVEKHLISRELATRNEGCAVAIDRKQKISVMVNEEDHIRLQIIQPGLSLKSAWNFANKMDDILEQQLDYAFLPQLGYLTSCPSNLGTGIRASAMLHLPGLVLSDNILQVVDAAKELGLTVRGIFGEGTKSFSNLFQISNQITLGETEESLIAKLDRITSAIVKHEINARLRLKEDFLTSQEIMDKVGRAFGILSHSHIISTQEALTYISYLRLGYDLGLIKSQEPPVFQQLLKLTQPAIIQLGHPDKTHLSRFQRDCLRATMLRKALKQMNLIYLE